MQPVYPTLTNDILFKIVFGGSDSEPVLRALLNALLERPPGRRIKRLEIVNPTRAKKHMADRGVVLDLLARDETNAQYNVEVQVAREPYFPERLVYYLATMHTQQLSPGARYARTAPSVIVCLLDHVMFPQHDDVIDVYELRGRRRGNVLSDHVQIHLVELPKFTKTSVDELSSPADHWLHLIRFAHEYARGAGTLPAKLTGEEGVAMAFDKMKHAMSDEEVRAWAMSREKGQWAIAASLYDAEQRGLEAGRQEGLEAGRQEGLEVGRQEGRQESLCETARRLLAEGLDVALIARATGFTADEVEALRGG